MGHYRSEMGFEAEDRRRELEKVENLRRRTEYIEKDIKERGIAAVLADIITDQTLYSIRSN